MELDPLEGTPLKRIHAYLFNDCIAIASWLATGGRRGPPRFKLQAVYDLQNIAVVNVRDLGTVKLAFKLLAFPDTRVFQCSTATSKVRFLFNYFHFYFVCFFFVRKEENFWIIFLNFCRKNGWINVTRPKKQDWLRNTRASRQKRLPRRNRL